MTLIRMNAGTGIITVNLDTLKKLRPDDRDAFMKLGREYSFKWAQTVNTSQNEMIESYKKEGMIINSLSDSEREKWSQLFEAQLIEAWVKTEEKAGATGVKKMTKEWLDAIGAKNIMP